jgi:hypothetical protein
MGTPGDDFSVSSDDEYEDYVEFQCPICSTPVTDADETCPGCGAIFVESDEVGTTDAPTEAQDLTEDYELDEDLDYSSLDDDALDAEIAAMEASLGDETPFEGELEIAIDDDDLLIDDELETDPFELDLAYEEDLEEEEEVEETFGTHVEVTAADHLLLEEMAKPTMMERMFHRAGLGMFIAGGAASVLIVLWDPIQGNPLNLGITQWRFLALGLAMFIVGFLVEMFQAYSLASDEDLLYREMTEG